MPGAVARWIDSSLPIYTHMCLCLRSMALMGGAMLSLGRGSTGGWVGRDLSYKDDFGGVWSLGSAIWTQPVVTSFPTQQCHLHSANSM
jgi:hypothetical protein